MATTQEYGLGEYRFPRGWFVVAPTAGIGCKPKRIRAFGQDLVLYRGETGRLVLLDAYCPHMGANLGAEINPLGHPDGQIEGDSIRCPYHAWRFGPDGQCNHIPYATGPIPAAARVRSWIVAEAFGCVLVWHDPEGAAPDYDAPVLPEWEDPVWITCPYDDLGTLDIHPQEIVDNIADAAHFGPTHAMEMVRFKVIIDGVIARQIGAGAHKTMVAAGAELESEAWYTGPGVLFARFSGSTDAIQIIAHTPVEDGVTRIWHGLITRASSVPHAETDFAAQRAYHDIGLAAFSQDFDIWRTKRPAINVMQLPTDGPFAKARQWYKQFYNPRARAAEFQQRVNGSHTAREKQAQVAAQ